jgi:hypothetical protein
MSCNINAGEGHLLTASAAHDLGKLLLCDEQALAKGLSEALRLVDMAYRVRCRTLGPSHPHTQVRAGHVPR